MTGSMPRRVALAAGVLSAATVVGAAPGQAAVPGAGAALSAAMVAQRSALRALPQPGEAVGGGYRRSVTDVNRAISRLRAVETAFATAARTTGPFPNLSASERLLRVALAGDSRAAVQLDEALWLLARRAPPSNTSVAQLRGDLREAVTACTALAKLIG